jgi:hypothetical protein
MGWKVTFSGENKLILSKKIIHMKTDEFDTKLLLERFIDGVNECEIPVNC